MHANANPPAAALPAAPAAGLPGDRMAVIAARRAFVVAKLHFIEAVAGLEEAPADSLQARVRAAEEPLDLWLLRAPVLAALSGTDPVKRFRARQLRHALAALFPDEVAPSALAQI